MFVFVLGIDFAPQISIQMTKVTSWKQFHLFVVFKLWIGIILVSSVTAIELAR